MVRIRLYSLFVSIPLLMIIAGFSGVFFEPAASFFWNTGTILITVGVALHVIFVSNIACPKCGKSPWMFKDSPVHGLPWADAICSRCGFDMRNGRVEPDVKS